LADEVRFNEAPHHLLDGRYAHQEDEGRGERLKLQQGEGGGKDGGDGRAQSRDKIEHEDQQGPEGGPLQGDRAKPEATEGSDARSGLLEGGFGRWLTF
jgi:hypothetical protein